MGQAVTQIKPKEGATPESTRDLKSQLAFLVACANAKLNEYQSNLEEMFLNPAGTDKKSVPGIRAIRWERGYRAGVDYNQIIGPFTECVNLFFGVKVGEENTAVAGLTKVALGSLDGILSNTHAGEQEAQKFFIFVQHNAIIRIDIKVWRYNFESAGVMAESENVFCYVFCTSVVDSSQLKLDELTYLLSEYAGDSAVVAYVDHIVRVWNKIRYLTYATGRGAPTTSLSISATPRLQVKGASSPVQKRKVIAKRASHQRHEEDERDEAEEFELETEDPVVVEA